MNTKLFRDILALVNKQFQKDKYITEDEFIYYLLGYKDTNNTNDKHNKFLLDLEDDLSDCLKGKNTLHAVLGGQYSTILSQSHHLKLDDLIKISLGKDSEAVREVIDNLCNSSERISSLYNLYSLPLLQQEDVRNLLINLFTVCITEKKPYLFASQKKKQLKPATFNKIYGRAEDSSNLSTALNKYHKIILMDQPGTGKSYFIKYCLSCWKLSDYCYIDYFYDLKTTKQKIEYYKDKKDLLFKTSENDLFDKDFSSALLVVDHVDFSEKILDELEELATYAINVIIITTANISHDSFYSFKLSTLSDDTLQSIFEMNTGISVNKPIWERLICISQRNVLLISLLAGQYKQIARNTDDFPNILDNLLQNLENSSIVHLNIAHGNTLTFKHQYDKEALDIIGHIKSIYAKFAAKYDKTDDLRIIMRFLCCLGYSPISILFLEELFAYDHDTLDIHLTNLYDMGLIQKNDLTIQLSSIMARSVFAFEIPSYTDCDEQIDKLSTFLQKYDQTLLYPYLSDTLLIFAQSIYPKVREKNNPNQKHATEKFENWQNLIYLIFNYYNQMGDFYIAEKISAIIKYPALISRHSSWDAYIFWLGNNIQSQNLIDVMPNLLDQVNDHISQYAGPSRIIDISSLLMNTLDLIIGLYCVFFFNNYFYNSYVDYMNTLVSTMKIL